MMRNKKNLSIKQKGFTMADILIALVVAGIVSTIYLPKIVELSDKRADVTIEEIQTIGGASLNYYLDNSKWPDQSNKCVNAIAVLTSSSEQYMGGIDSTSPFSTPYQTGCSSYASSTFFVAVDTNSDYSSYLANQMAATNYRASRTTTTFVRPFSVPLLDKVMFLENLPNSSPSWNARNNTIHNIPDISFTFGRYASEAIYDMGLMCDYSVSNCFRGIDNKIKKPICGNNSLRPSFNITGVSRWGVEDDVSRWSYATASRTYEIAYPDNQYWKVKFILQGNKRPSTETFFSYITKCRS